MKLSVVIILINIFSFNYLNAQENTGQKKISYFDLKKENVSKQYGYLSQSIPRSIRSVLSAEDFKSIKTEEKKIQDIYNREEIVSMGKELGSDLIICGKYKILQDKLVNKIQLTVLVYDVNGGERVIERRFIGGTGTGMFVMIDSAAENIKTEVNRYFGKKQKLLAQARERRLKREQLEQEKRQQQIEQELKDKTIKTRMNNSLYLKSHVCQQGQIKLFTFLAYKHYGYDTTASYNVPLVGIVESDTEYSYNVFYSQISLSGSFLDNFEIGMDLLIHMKESINIKFEYNSFEKEFSDDGDKYLNQPVFFLKWRALQDENHGLNFTLMFGFQPRISENMGSEQLEAFLSKSMVSHNFIFGFYVDKTLGRFTPFVNLDFIVIKKVEGKDVTGAQVKMLPGEDDHVFALNIKAGTEWRVTRSFIIQPAFGFTIRPKYNVSNSQTTGPYYYFSVGSNFILEIAKDTAFSLEFKYYYYTNARTPELPSVSGLNNPDINGDLTGTFFIYFYFAILFDT